MNEKQARVERRPLLGTPRVHVYGHQQPLCRSGKLRCVSVLGFLAAVSLVAFFRHRPSDLTESPIIHPAGKAKEPAVEWSWNDITPSRDLEWEPCYDIFECARLDVPMDWQDPSEDKRVVLGIIKLPAQTQPGKLSPLIVNPGGPGGSGIAFVRQAGKLLQTIVGRNHDVISFDPRGVGVSTPRVECWGSTQRRKLWRLQDPGICDERPGLIYDILARSVAYSAACEVANNDTDILEHISTPYHARDMLQILDKSGHAKLRYWGFSYGTVLGGTFAGLYPDRVERLISDGNCDYHDWWHGTREKFIKDADQIFSAFDEACHKVGASVCAFWAPSPSAVRDRRARLLESLKRKPVLVSGDGGGDGLPMLVTYSAVQRLTQTSLYKPLAKFPQLAAVYAALERGDGQAFVDMVLMGRREDPPASDELCGADDVPATMPHETGQEEDAFPAIMCADGVPVGDDADEMAAYAERMQETSRWAGAVNILFHVLCAGKKVRPKWDFSDDDFLGDTAHPILYIGNMADNVTPFSSAVNNSARFPSSGLLKQNSYGHCSLAAPSKCTARHIRSYMQDGALPPAGAECDPDYGLFELPQDGSEEEKDETVVISEEDELATAMLQLARDVELPRLHR